MKKFIKILLVGGMIVGGSASMALAFGHTGWHQGGISHGPWHGGYYWHGGYGWRGGISVYPSPGPAYWYAPAPVYEYAPYYGYPYYGRSVIIVRPHHHHHHHH